jgi:uncharacterized protein YjcR
MPFKYPDEERERLTDQAEALYADGLILRDISEQLGVSKTTIWAWLKQRGVPMRPTPADYRNRRLAQQMVRRAERRRAKEERKRAWYESQPEPDLWAIEQFIRSI